MGASSGTVTFLFTDVEGSTRLWEAAPGAMRAALGRHDEIVRAAIGEHGGFVFSTGGDGFAAAFGGAGDALAAALDGQAALGAEAWPDGVVIRVRMGLHTGEAEERDGDFFGPAVNRAARLMAVAHGGQIVCSFATADVAGGVVELTDLGEHRLRDLSTAQRVFQVGAGVFPALRSLGTFASNLPAEASVFVGREAELAELSVALEASRVVTLTGVGGVGKTRLALHAAADVLPRYPDGVWLVELAPVLDPDALVEVIAGAVGVRERPGQSLAAGVTGFWRGKELLVILDNCEHVLDAVAGFVAAVVAACPKVAVLATSREGLRVSGERLLVVSSLGLPAEGSAIGDADAVRLFVARAVEARGSFELTAANAGVVDRLVRGLDGIPLAIELAAARVRSLTPAELAERLDDRFRLLAGGRRAAVQRHQTLRRAIDWSYDLLSDAERAVLNRAAVFAGDFSLDSAEAVVAGDGIDAVDVVDVLGHLVDKSLMVAEDRGGVSRYRLLETIREYAQERLEGAGEAEAVRDRHGQHYATFTAAVGAGLGGSDEIVWKRRVDAEMDNVRAALAWSVAVGDGDLALRLVAPLAVLQSATWYTTYTWAPSVVALPETRGHRLYSQMLAVAGYAEAVGGDLEAARRTCRAAVELADGVGVDEAARRRVLATAGGAATFGGDFEEVGQLFRHSAALARAAGADRDLAVALLCAAVALHQTGDIKTATVCADEALDLAERLRSPTTLHYASGVAGLVRRATDPGRALRLLDQSIRTAELLGDDTAIGDHLANQASIHIEQGQWPEAARLIARSLDHYRRAGSQKVQSLWISPCALILEAVGDDEASATLHGAAVMTLTPFGPAWADRQTNSEQALRRRLGNDRFEECAAHGRTVDIDDLAAYAQGKLQ